MIDSNAPSITLWLCKMVAELNMRNNIGLNHIIDFRTRNVKKKELSFSKNWIFEKKQNRMLPTYLKNKNKNKIICTPVEAKKC